MVAQSDLRCAPGAEPVETVQVPEVGQPEAVKRKRGRPRKYARTDGVAGGFLNRGGNGKSGMQVIVRPDEMGGTSPDAGPVEPGVGIRSGKGKGRKTPLAAFGLVKSMLDEGDPDYAPCIYQADKYRKTRMKELVALHGHLSAGAGALLASASLALGGSRFLYQRVAQVADPMLQAQYLKQASQLADSARQCELASWELASREGALRRHQDAASSNQPWLTPSADADDGRRRGRPSNMERQLTDRNVHTSKDIVVDVSNSQADQIG